ncbi:hypothetical protein BDN72DRAFT_849153 [Pluteus cervinus]|uniref:Uncharacterized protein n=1 Tax=Pluteus cervinus TaxID=181527 RepID=A0ACD3A8G4_9AGAR|nr:hypothetical protein BDN72DRAFT_849153 [Pluteus cervinus]
MSSKKDISLRSHLGLTDDVKDIKWKLLRTVVNDLIRTHLDLSPSSPSPTAQDKEVETVQTKVMQDARFREYFPSNRREQDKKILKSHIRKQARWMRSANRDVAEEQGSSKHPREDEDDSVIVKRPRLAPPPSKRVKLIIPAGSRASTTGHRAHNSNTNEDDGGLEYRDHKPVVNDQPSQTSRMRLRSSFGRITRERALSVLRGSDGSVSRQVGIGSQDISWLLSRTTLSKPIAEIDSSCSGRGTSEDQPNQPAWSESVGPVDASMNTRATTPPPGVSALILGADAQSTLDGTPSRAPSIGSFSLSYPSPQSFQRQLTPIATGATPLSAALARSSQASPPVSRFSESTPPPSPFTADTAQWTPRPTPLTSFVGSTSQSTPRATPGISSAANSNSETATQDGLYIFLTELCNPPLPELYAPLLKYGIDMAYVHAISKWPEERIRRFVSGVKKRVQAQSQVDMGVVDGEIKPIHWDVFEHHVWKLGH